MIIKTVKFGNYYAGGSFTPTRGRLTLDDKGVIRYHNSDLKLPTPPRPLPADPHFRRETVEKWKDRLIRIIGESRQAMHLDPPPPLGTQCGPFLLVESDGHRAFLARSAPVKEGIDCSRPLHETPNVLAILTWRQEFELAVRRAKVTQEALAVGILLTLSSGPKLVLSAKSTDHDEFNGVEFEEKLALGECCLLKPDSEPVVTCLNADYLHDVCGVELELSIQDGLECVSFATLDDRYRYVLMPMEWR